MKTGDIKNKIKDYIPVGYDLKTNFSCADFLVQVGNFVIIAKPICTDIEINYKFFVDTEFLSSKEITYDELVMLKSIIEILEENKKISLSRLKKWKVSEYLADQELRKQKSEAMFEFLKLAFLKKEEF